MKSDYKNYQKPFIFNAFMALTDITIQNFELSKGDKIDKECPFYEGFKAIGLL